MRFGCARVLNQLETLACTDHAKYTTPDYKFITLMCHFNCSF
jgi:hypothetical protein